MWVSRGSRTTHSAEVCDSLLGAAPSHSLISGGCGRTALAADMPCVAAAGNTSPRPRPVPITGIALIVALVPERSSIPDTITTNEGPAQLADTHVYHLSHLELDSRAEEGSVGVLTWDGAAGDFAYLDPAWLRTVTRHNWKHR